MNIVEAGILIALLGLIVAAVLVAVIPKRDAARIDLASLDLKLLEDALQLFRQRQGRYPDAPEGFHALVGVSLLKSFPKDPWGHDYVYRLEEEGPVILSYGEDGKPGGEGMDADLSRKVVPPSAGQQAPPPSPPANPDGGNPGP